jgi:hypothetical protein
LALGSARSPDHARPLLLQLVQLRLQRVDQGRISAGQGNVLHAQYLAQAGSIFLSKMLALILALLVKKGLFPRKWHLVAAFFIAAKGKDEHRDVFD